MESDRLKSQGLDLANGRDSTVFIPVRHGPALGEGVHAAGECNGLCSPPRHVEVLWCHPQFPIDLEPAAVFDRTFRRWTGMSARLVGRAELPPREDGWLAWTVEVTDDLKRGIDE